MLGTARVGVLIVQRLHIAVSLNNHLGELLSGRLGPSRRTGPEHRPPGACVPTKGGDQTVEHLSVTPVPRPVSERRKYTGSGKPSYREVHITYHERNRCEYGVPPHRITK